MLQQLNVVGDLQIHTCVKEQGENSFRAQVIAFQFISDTVILGLPIGNGIWAIEWSRDR